MRFYYQHIYAIIGTLVFHIILVGSLLLRTVSEKHSYTEDEILIDMSLLEELPEPEPEELPEQSSAQTQAALTNRVSNQSQGVNSSRTVDYQDPFFDEDFQKEMEEAQALADDVSSQLGKKTKALEEYAMPEQTTDGQKPEEISNVVYSGESNISYDLENRYHRRMPIPVYLAKGGGRVVVNIWVNRSGKVTKAVVKSISNAKDPLLGDYAVQAAKRTVFNTDNNAPNSQRGTITYVFVAQ